MEIRVHRRLVHLLVLAAMLGGSVFGVWTGQNGLAEAEPPSQPVETTRFLLMPLMSRSFPWANPFGVETGAALTQGSSLLNRAVDLKLGQVRLNARISWRQLQPVENGEIQWSLLAGFENELRALKAAGIKPVVVVDDYPTWSTIPGNSCGPLKTAYFQVFAEFMRNLVSRYSKPEFDVHHWELGNEPDVDPSLVPANSVYGCWGDISDNYYGGRHYGEMIKVVGPVIKAEDFTAQVWIGGLLLASPNTTDKSMGKPERFLQGILESGAAPYFDVVPYHAYTNFANQVIDYDNNNPASVWYGWGGIILGKARFLRQVMSQYGVNKPVYINETGLMCPEIYQSCKPPGELFDRMQADFLVRSFVRGLSENIMGYAWYTLDGPGWRYGGLLVDHSIPKPAYDAYHQLSLQLRGSKYIEPVNYSAKIEAYAFQRGINLVHVVWAKENESLTITVPETKFLEARTKYGVLISLAPVNGQYNIPVQFDPIFILRKP